MRKERLEKEIEMAWEEWRGTHEAKALTRQGYFTPIALNFAKFVIERREAEG